MTLQCLTLETQLAAIQSYALSDPFYKSSVCYYNTSCGNFLLKPGISATLLQIPALVHNYNMSAKDQLDFETPYVHQPKTKLLELLNHRSSVLASSTAYDNDLRDFALWDYLTSGRKNYETRQANLPLPSTSTLDKHLTDTYARIDEGMPRVKGCKQFLDANGYSKYVILSEDGTRVESNRSKQMLR